MDVCTGESRRGRESSPWFTDQVSVSNGAMDSEVDSLCILDWNPKSRIVEALFEIFICVV